MNQTLQTILLKAKANYRLTTTPEYPNMREPSKYVHLSQEVYNPWQPYLKTTPLPPTTINHLPLRDPIDIAKRPFKN